MTTANVSIHRAPADFADWDGVRTLIQGAFAYMNGRIDPPSSARLLSRESMAADAAAGALLLATRADELVGCLFVRPKDDALYLGKLAVRSGMNRSGIGRALVDAARDEAVKRDLGTLELSVRIELNENHATFARMGFVKTVEFAHPGYERPTSITMRAPVTR